MDIKLGIKSTAILFDDNDRVIIAMVQGLMLLNLVPHRSPGCPVMALLRRPGDSGWAVRLSTVSAAQNAIATVVFAAFHEQ